MPATLPPLPLDGSGRTAVDASNPASRARSADQLESSAPAQRNHSPYPDGIEWGTMSWILLLHVGALAAPFTFSWQGLGLLVLLHWLTGGIGVCLGYHRLLTHSSFATFKPVRWLLAFAGALSGEGSALFWVVNHRKHHALSDKEGDPHSPLDGSWWSHVLWLGRRVPPQQRREMIQRWAPDLDKDPVLRFMGNLYLLWHILLGLVLFATGYWLGGLYLGCSWLVWGLFLRLVLVLHTTWFVNSASHMWGYVNYQINDKSRNNWWVALLTYGEGWHNNHHAYPRMAKHGHRWWEIDMTFWVIRLLQACGLAWNVIDYKQRSEPA